MIPVSDAVRSRTTPYVNIALIISCVLVFLYELTLSELDLNRFFIDHGVIPVQLVNWLKEPSGLDEPLTVITSAFMHGGFLHLGGNMLFLWVFGDNVEDFFGHLPYLLFYLVCGIGAGLLHILFNLNSSLPAVGASGAISGVMGAYALLYPRARVLTLVFVFLVPIPAIFILGYWFLLQFLGGISALGATATGGVAWWAHVGGFLVGLSLTELARRE